MMPQLPTPIKKKAEQKYGYVGEDQFSTLAKKPDQIQCAKHGDKKIVDNEKFQDTLLQGNSSILHSKEKANSHNDLHPDTKDAPRKPALQGKCPIDEQRNVLANSRVEAATLDEQTKDRLFLNCEEDSSAKLLENEKKTAVKILELPQDKAASQGTNAKNACKDPKADLSIQTSMAKERIAGTYPKKVPGLEYLVCKNFRTFGPYSFSCLICQNSIDLVGDDIMNHLKSRDHLLKIMILDSFETYLKWKDIKPFPTNIVMKELMELEEKKPNHCLKVGEACAVSKLGCSLEFAKKVYESNKKSLQCTKEEEKVKIQNKMEELRKSFRNFPKYKRIVIISNTSYQDFLKDFNAPNLVDVFFFKKLKLREICSFIQSTQKNISGEEVLWLVFMGCQIFGTVREIVTCSRNKCKENVPLIIEPPPKLITHELIRQIKIHSKRIKKIIPQSHEFFFAPLIPIQVCVYENTSHEDLHNIKKSFPLSYCIKTDEDWTSLERCFSEFDRELCEIACSSRSSKGHPIYKYFEKLSHLTQPIKNCISSNLFDFWVQAVTGMLAYSLKCPLPKDFPTLSSPNTNVERTQNSMLQSASVPNETLQIPKRAINYIPSVSSSASLKDAGLKPLTKENLHTKEEITLAFKVRNEEPLTFYSSSCNEMEEFPAKKIKILADPVESIETSVSEKAFSQTRSNNFTKKIDHVVFVGRSTIVNKISKLCTCWTGYSLWEVELPFDLVRLKQEITKIKQLHKSLLFIILADLMFTKSKETYIPCINKNCTSPLRYICKDESKNRILDAIDALNSVMKQCQVENPSWNFFLLPLVPSYVINVNFVSEDMFHDIVHILSESFAILADNADENWNSSTAELKSLWNSAVVSSFQEYNGDLGLFQDFMHNSLPLFEWKEPNLRTLTVKSETETKWTSSFLDFIERNVLPFMTSVKLEEEILSKPVIEDAQVDPSKLNNPQLTAIDHHRNIKLEVPPSSSNFDNQPISSSAQQHLHPTETVQLTNPSSISGNIAVPNISETSKPNQALDHVTVTSTNNENQSSENPNLSPVHLGANKLKQHLESNPAYVDELLVSLLDASSKIKSLCTDDQYEKVFLVGKRSHLNFLTSLPCNVKKIEFNMVITEKSSITGLLEMFGTFSKIKSACFFIFDLMFFVKTSSHKVCCKKASCSDEIKLHSPDHSCISVVEEFIRDLSEEIATYILPLYPNVAYFASENSMVDHDLAHGLSEHSGLLLLDEPDTFNFFIKLRANWNSMLNLSHSKKVSLSCVAVRYIKEDLDIHATGYSISDVGSFLPQMGIWKAFCETFISVSIKAIDEPSLTGKKSSEPSENRHGTPVPIQYPSSDDSSKRLVETEKSYSAIIASNKKTQEKNDILLSYLFDISTSVKYGSDKPIFEEILFVGASSLLLVLKEFPYNAKFIAHDMTNIKPEIDACSIMNKLGPLTERTLCLLVFNCNFLGIKRSTFGIKCSKSACRSSQSFLTIDHFVDDFEFVSKSSISKKLRSVDELIAKLNKHLPTFILPLYPQVAFHYDSNSPLYHKFIHELPTRDSFLALGQKQYWMKHFSDLRKEWATLLANNHKKFSSFVIAKKYLLENRELCIFGSNNEDFKTNWSEVEIWKAFVDAFLTVMVKLPNEIKASYETAPSNAAAVESKMMDSDSSSSTQNQETLNISKDKSSKTGEFEVSSELQTLQPEKIPILLSTGFSHSSVPYTSTLQAESTLPKLQTAHPSTSLTSTIPSCTSLLLTTSPVPLQSSAGVSPLHSTSLPCSVTHQNFAPDPQLTFEPMTSNLQTSYLVPSSLAVTVSQATPVPSASTYPSVALSSVMQTMPSLPPPPSFTPLPQASVLPVYSSFPTPSHMPTTHMPLVPPSSVTSGSSTSSWFQHEFPVIEVSGNFENLPLDLFKNFATSADSKSKVEMKNGNLIMQFDQIMAAQMVMYKLSNLQIGDCILKSTFISNHEVQAITEHQRNFVNSLFLNVLKPFVSSIVKDIKEKIKRAVNIATFKTTKCKKIGILTHSSGYKVCENYKTCSKFHSSGDRRRNPFLVSYSAKMCDNSGSCPRGVKCFFSHNIYEQRCHPSSFQIMPCPSETSNAPCTKKSLCKGAHKGTPEMFYTTSWKDLVVFGLANSFLFLAGAIRSRYKREDLKTTKILFITPDSEMVELVDNAVKETAAAHTVKMLTLNTDNVIETPGSYGLVIGTISQMIEHESLYTPYTTVSAIIVDNLRKLIDTPQKMDSLCRIFQNIKATPNLATSIHKVFVVDENENSNIVDYLSQTLGITLHSSRMVKDSLVATPSASSLLASLNLIPLPLKEPPKITSENQALPTKDTSCPESSTSPCSPPSNKKVESHSNHKSSSKERNQKHPPSQESSPSGTSSKDSMKSPSPHHGSFKEKDKSSFMQPSSEKESLQSKSNQLSLNRNSPEPQSDGIMNSPEAPSIPYHQKENDVEFHSNTLQHSTSRPRSPNRGEKRLLSPSPQDRSLPSKAAKKSPPRMTDCDSTNEACQPFGSDTSALEEFEEKKKSIIRDIEEEYDAYLELPEIHPKYEESCGLFKKIYEKNYGKGQNEEHREKCYLEYWKNILESTKKNEIYERLRQLKESINTIHSDSVEVSLGEQTIIQVQSKDTQPSNSNDQEHSKITSFANNEFSISAALDIMESVKDELGILEPSAYALIKDCRSKGSDETAILHMLKHPETEMLIKMIIDKLYTRIELSSAGMKCLLRTAHRWLDKILNMAKASDPQVSEEPINLEAIATITLGKSACDILNVIKTALAFETSNLNPSKEQIDDIFLKICSMHFEMSSL